LIKFHIINRGMAWFYRPYAKDLSRDDATAYEQAEAQAAREKRGLWGGAPPVPPWDYRRGSRQAKMPGRPATSTEPIIGNRNSHVYHLSGCPSYSKVSERDRVLFKTEAEARAAGYRKAVNCPWQRAGRRRPTKTTAKKRGRDMRIMKKAFDYVVGALGIVVGSLFIYAAVRAIVRVVGTIARGEPVDLTPRFKRHILSLCVLAAVTAYVKLRQKYKGDKK
jgi:hypothetical protein